ncbi:MAG: hypothetical protein U1F98_15305 [Verrucomicrobiota bacterium]
MNLIDFILNLAGLLLWFNWRSVSMDPLARATPATLVGTVRRAQPSRIKRWHLLAFLGGLILVRAFFYGQLGPSVNWTPKLDLSLAVLAFPLSHRGGMFFLSALLFSLLSFLRLLAIVYFWMLILEVINSRATRPDPIQKLISQQLGRVARWPSSAQLVLPVGALALAWVALHPLLVATGAANVVRSNLLFAGQSLLVGLSIFLSLKFLLPAILFAHLVASYVYLGNNPLWDFISTTARHLLGPLPLRFGKVDLSPVVGIVLALLLLHALPGWLVSWLSRTHPEILPQ